MSTLTVKQLIRELEQYDGNTPIYAYDGDDVVREIHNTEAETAFHLIEQDEYSFVFDEEEAKDSGGFTHKEKVIVLNFG